MLQNWKDKPWFEQYELAALETSPAALPNRVRVAEAAIRARVWELGYSESDQQEMSALNEALTALRLLAEHAHLRKKGPD